MTKRPLKTLFSILVTCSLLTGMVILSPVNIARAEGVPNILFQQTPTVPTDADTMSYTSTAVPFGTNNVTYELADDFWGVTDYSIDHVKWYGVAMWWPWSGSGDPSGMKFRITFYQRNGQTFTQVAQFSDVTPDCQTYGGMYPFGTSESVQGYCFDVDLPSPVSLTTGWISIQNTSTADGSTFLWLNSHQGNNNCVQIGQWSFMDDLAFTLTGTTPRYYTVTFQAGANGSLTGTTTFPNILSGTTWASAIPNVPTPVPAFGYKFSNWSPSFPTIINADIIYTANFVKDQDPNHWLSVAFQAGAHGWLYGTSYFYDILSGTPWASAVTVPTPNGDAGYKFGSWSPSFPATVTANATYTASFVIDPSQTFTVTYDGNGNTSGTVPTDGTIYHSGDTVTVLGSDKLQQTGCYFAGWATTNYDGRELSWTPGSTFVGSANITLYAKWVTTVENTATLSGTRSARPDQKITLNVSASGAGPNKFIPPGAIHFFYSTDPLSSNWNQLGETVPLVRGKASLTVTSLTSPGTTYYIYAWFYPSDPETYDDFYTNVWTVTIK